MALDHDKYKNIVYNKIKTYANDQVTIFKLVSVAQDIYRQGAAVYDAGTQVGAVARTDPDHDKLSSIGRVEQDRVRFTISRKELEEKFPALAAGEWVKLEDKVQFEGKAYAIDEVKLTGRVFGDFTIVLIVAHENPDLL